VEAFTLKTIDGRTIRSADLRGRPYVVNFWASWCVPCRREHGALQAFYARYQPKGVELLGIMVQSDTVRGARAFREELGGDWPLLHDPKSKVALDFGVGGPPETFVVDEDGIITVKYTGAVVPGTLEREMKRIGLTG